MTMRKPSILQDREAVKTAIEASNSIREALNYLGLRAAGGNYKAFKKACEKHGLIPPTPSSEFWSKVNSNRTIEPKYSNDEVFVANSTYLNRTSIKKRLRLLVPEWKCFSCGLGEVWNGQTLTLQLDHINGIYNDNRLENLQLLCPNCHSQTPTFAGRSSATHSLSLGL